MSHDEDTTPASPRALYRELAALRREVRYMYWLLICVGVVIVNVFALILILIAR